MPKLLLLSFCLTCILVPFVVNAEQAYVGLSIQYMEREDGSEIYSLSEGNVFKLYSVVGAVSTLVSTKTLEEALFTGSDFIYLDNLIDMQPSADYRFEIQNKPCQGQYDNIAGICWYAGSVGQNCNQVCNDYGGVASDCSEEISPDISQTFAMDDYQNGCWDQYAFCPAGYYTYNSGGIDYPDWATCNYCQEEPYSCEAAGSADDFVPLCACKNSEATFLLTFEGF